MLSIEYVSFEASQYVHSYSNIEFTFPTKGTINNNIAVYTMKLNMYDLKVTWDVVRLGFEVLYVLLLIYNIFLFIKKLMEQNQKYQRWRKIEIDQLSEIERQYRHQKKPEWIRCWDALFTSFTYFDIIYFTLAIVGIVLWIVYIFKANEVDFALPPDEPVQPDYISDFY